MNNETSGCVIGAATIIISIVSGILAWQWIDPDTFLGAVVFIIVWGVFSYILHLIIGGIIVALFD